MSTRIQANHCSMYLRASIHIPTMHQRRCETVQPRNVTVCVFDKYPGDADEKTR